jgi:hypothetical protein
MNDTFATIPQIASSLLRLDMKQQVSEINSVRNWLETIRSGKWPTRNNRAGHFIDKHEKEFRRKHPLTLPVSAFNALRHD